MASPDAVLAISNETVVVIVVIVAIDLFAITFAPVPFRI